MAHRESAASSMSFNELRSFIKREKEKGLMVPHEIELPKNLLSICSLFIDFTGVSVASQKRRGGEVLQLAQDSIRLYLQ